jgi:hypothetical protein
MTPLSWMRSASSASNSMDSVVVPICRICELAEVCSKLMRSWLVPCYEPTPPDPLALRRIIVRSVVTERAGHTKRAIHLLWRSLQY